MDYRPPPGLWKASVGLAGGGQKAARLGAGRGGMGGQWAAVLRWCERSGCR